MAEWRAPQLTGRVALVTGASRGIGRGVAAVLAQAGATVYVTARTKERGTGAFPGSLDELVEASGGRAVAVVCDHADDAQVDALFERVRREQGRLDVLVNNVWSRPVVPNYFTAPFWEQPRALWDELASVGLRSHLICSQLAARQMVAQKSGLIVTISSSGAEQRLFNLHYSLIKGALDRMIGEMAFELTGHGVAAVSLWPGYAVTEKLKVLIERGAKLPWDAERGHSMEYSGRAVAHLAADPKVLSRTGKAWALQTLAEQYGFTDLDGRVPPQDPPVFPRR